MKKLILLLLCIKSLSSLGQATCLNDPSYKTSPWTTISMSPARDYSDRVEIDYNLSSFNLNAGDVGLTKIKHSNYFNITMLTGSLPNASNYQYDRIQLINCSGQYEGGGDSMVLVGNEFGCKSMAMNSGQNVVDTFTYQYPLLSGGCPTNPPTGLGGVINNIPAVSTGFGASPIWNNLTSSFLNKGETYELAYVDNHPGWQALDKFISQCTNPFNPPGPIKSKYRTAICNSLDCVYAGNVKCTIVLYKACNPVTPQLLQVRNVSGGTAFLEWNPISGISNYQYQLAKLNTPSYDINTANIVGTSYRELNLEPCTWYKWRVRSVCLNGTVSSWSDGPTIYTGNTGVEMKYYVFNRSSGAIGLGHTGVAYSVKTDNNTTYYFGAVENPTGSMGVVAGGYNGGWYAVAYNEAAVLNIMKQQYGYDSYKVSTVSKQNPACYELAGALRILKEFPNRGYAVISNNCADAVYNVLNYGGYGLPFVGPVLVGIAPNAWYTFLPSFGWSPQITL